MIKFFHSLSKLVKLGGNIDLLLHLTINFLSYDNQLCGVRLAFLLTKDCVLHHADQTHFFSVQYLIFGAWHFFIIRIYDRNEHVQHNNDIEDAARDENEEAILIPIIKSKGIKFSDWSEEGLLPVFDVLWTVFLVEGCISGEWLFLNSSIYLHDFFYRLEGISIQKDANEEYDQEDSHLPQTDIDQVDNPSELLYNH